MGDDEQASARQSAPPPLLRTEEASPPTRGLTIPAAGLSSEVRTILTRMPGVPRLCASLMYGSGLRLSSVRSRV